MFRNQYGKTGETGGIDEGDLVDASPEVDEGEVDEYE